MKSLTKNLILLILIAFITLFIGINILFFITRLLPGDPVLAYLGDRFTSEDYLRELQRLGLDKPIIEQYFRYLGDLFTGNWGVSISIDKGLPVFDVIRTRVFRTFELLILPLIFGLMLGIRLGVVSIKTKQKTLKKKLIQIYEILFLTIPIFFLGLIFQYFFAYLIPIFPAHNFKNPGIGDPPLITGFRILDSILSAQFFIAIDTIFHYILPGILLTIVITALTIRLVRHSFQKESPNTSIMSNNLIIGLTFGVIFLYIILVDLTFNLNSLGSTLIIALQNSDIFLLSVILFLIVMSFVIISLIANILFTLYQNGQFTIPKILYPSENYDDDNNDNEDDDENNYDDLKVYFIGRLKSPLTIIGLAIFLFSIIITIFPQLLTPYAIEEIFQPIPGAFDPPSPDHLLGQGYLGRDLLAQIIYGIRNSLIFGFGAALISLVGGFLFGFLANLSNQKLRNIVLGLMVFFCVFPTIILVIFIVAIYGQRFEFLMISIGVLLMPLYTYIFATTEFKFPSLCRRLVTYTPLFASYAIFLHISLGFIGFADPISINLGNVFVNGRFRIYDAPWATLWPGTAIFILIAGLILLHEGFQKPIS